MLGAGRAAVFAEAGVEVDDGFDRAARGGEPANEQGRRRQRAGDVGDHPFAKREAATFGLPRGFEAGGSR